MPLKSHIFLSSLAFVVLLPNTNGAAAEEFVDNPIQVRLAVGLSAFEDTTFYDTDCTTFVDGGPYALFGCGDGPDGKPRGGYGEFDTSFLGEVAVGYRVNDWLAGEIAVTYRPEWQFSGQSNFTDIPLGTAPVEADGWNVSLMANAQIMLQPLLGLSGLPFQPFVTGGLGGAYNHTGEVLYQFTHRGLDDRRYTRSGNNLDLAWSLGAGFSLDLTEQVKFQLSYRYVDLGKIETDLGNLVWSRDIDPILIESTEAELTANEVLLSVIYRY